jgi:hypothetical protein
VFVKQMKRRSFRDREPEDARRQRVKSERFVDFAKQRLEAFARAR